MSVNADGTKPQLRLTIGGVSHAADYLSGSGSSVLVFRYQVQTGDNGALALGSTLALNGGSLSVSDGSSVALGFTVPNTSGLVADTTAPAKPAAPTTLVASPSKNTNPTISGTAEIGSSVTLYDGSTSIGTATADSSGKWSITPVAALSEGAHSLSIKAMDAAGNVSVISSALSYVVDLTAPVITSALTASGAYGTTGFSYTIVASGAAAYSATGLPAGLSLNTTSGVISGTPGVAGDINVTIGATDVAGNTGSATLKLSIAKAPLTLTGLSANHRVYDGSLAVAISGTPLLSGVVSGDEAKLALGGSAVGAFADKAVGTGKPVTVTGLSVSGDASSNYTFTLPSSLTANVTALPITVSGGKVASKLADGSTVATQYEWSRPRRQNCGR